MNKTEHKGTHWHHSYQTNKQNCIHILQSIAQVSLVNSTKRVVERKEKKIEEKVNANRILIDQDIQWNIVVTNVKLCFVNNLII